MRGLAAGLGLAGALAAGPLALAQSPAAAPASVAAPGKAPAVAPYHVNLTDPVLAYYPAAARAAGVEGQAVIRCKRDEHAALTGCTLVSETPAGQGFGAAALAMAAKSPPNPKLAVKDAPSLPAEDITLTFQLRPPFISPDVTRMAHVVRNAQIVTKPSEAQIEAAYPSRALANQVQGAAVIECAVTGAGRLADCSVFNEAPTGYGFGQAAVDLAGDFTMKPRLVDGEPVAGAPVRIAIAFAHGDPDAPLTLGGKPADSAEPGGNPPPTRPDRDWGGPDGTGGFGHGGPGGGGFEGPGTGVGVPPQP